MFFNSNYRLFAIDSFNFAFNNLYDNKVLRIVAALSIFLGNRYYGAKEFSLADNFYT